MIISAVTENIFYCISCPNCRRDNGLCFEKQPSVSETFAGYCVYCYAFVSGYIQEDKMAKITLVDSESRNRLSKIRIPLFFMRNLKDIYF